VQAPLQVTERFWVRQVVPLDEHLDAATDDLEDTVADPDDVEPPRSLRPVDAVLGLELGSARTAAARGRVGDGALRGAQSVYPFNRDYMVPPR